MFWFWLLTLLLGINGSNGDCSRAGYEAKCSSVDEEQLYTFLADHENVLNTLVVENASIPAIEILKIYEFMDRYSDGLYSLTIRNSKVKSVLQGAQGVGGYRYIQDLDLSFNDLEDIHFLENLETFRKIVLHHNRIESLDAHAHLRRMKNLRYLDLSHNKIKNLTVFTNNDRLIHLNLSHNMLEQIGDSFKFLRIVEVVDLSHNKLSNISLNDFERLINIESLNLSHNNIHTVGYVKPQITAKMRYRTYGYKKLTIDFSFNKVVTIRGIFDFNLGRNNLLKLIFMGNNGLEGLNFLLNINGTVHDDSLILRNNKIKTLLPYNFKNYSLNKLDLSFNEIESIVPLTFDGLATQELCLDHNKIAQMNVEVFGSIANLTKLNLANNPITTIDGSFSKVFLKNFSLDLSHCSLNKVPVGLNEQGFSEIHLNHNNIDSIEPDSFSSLKILDLSYNKLRNLQSGVLSGLVIEGLLNLSHNSLSSLDSVFNNTKIQNLSLTGISLTKLSQKDLIGLRKVEYLDLSKTGISELNKNTFDQLTQLKNISLNDNSIQALPSNFFGYNENLISLSIIRNPLSTISSDSFPHKMRLKYLFLTINGKMLERRLSNLVYLEQLHLVHSAITEIQENSFKGLVSLKKLNFKNSTVLKIEPGAFLGLLNLQDLDERNLFANVSTLESRMFVGLENLQNLNLSGIGIDTIEDGAFLGLDNLLNLNLSHNKIGKLPKNAFIGLKALKILDLSNNNLTGLIPFPIGVFSNLIELTHLHLQYNTIRTLQNGVFSNLLNLKFLNLSHNQLGNLNEVAIFPLRNLNVFDINSNKILMFGYETILEHISTLKTIGIGENEWGCWNLVRLLNYFSKHSINYNNISILEFKTDNIDGISCVK